jgi:ATP-dependent Clp protease ATP-binding subunit ClpC
MGQRFTGQARRAMILAQEEARMLEHSQVGTEHLLLGLLHAAEDIAARALDVPGITPGQVRAQVEQLPGRVSAVAPVRMTYTPRAKTVLDQSWRWALRLGDNHVGTEHLLLALTSERASTAGQILVRLGADLTVLRQRVMRLRSAAAAQQGPGSEHQSRPAPGQDGPPVRAAISRHGL